MNGNGAQPVPGQLTPEQAQAQEDALVSPRPIPMRVGVQAVNDQMVMMQIQSATGLATYFLDHQFARRVAAMLVEETKRKGPSRLIVPEFAPPPDILGGDGA